MMLTVTVGILGTLTPLAATTTRGDGRHPANLRFEDCRQQIGVFPIDEGEASAYLPDGFRAVPFQDSSPFGPSGAPAAPGGSATLQLIATSCTPAGGDPASDEVSVAQAWIYVDPPDELEDDRLGPTPSPYVVVPWMVASSGEFTRHLRSWGLPVHVGDVENAFEGVPGTVQLGRVLAEGGGATVRLESVVPAVLRDTTAERLRLFGVRNRRLTSVVDFIEDEHTHLLAGTATLGAEMAAAGFPVPVSPGVSIHVQAGYGMTWERIGSWSGGFQRRAPRRLAM